ncbi:hypothetical protein EBR77_04305 [bacterium]|nr:hypothetical protein [bacterium]
MIHDITRIKNRTFLVLGFFLILYCTIIGSLYILQIQKSQFFHTLGQKQYNVKQQAPKIIETSSRQTNIVKN